MNMNLLLQRYSDNKESTQGLLFNKEPFKLMCYTIEDEHRDEKVMKETRIPSGFYEIKFREEDTPLTLKYRKKFSFFKYHLEITNVPNFTGVYIHIGNTDLDSAGCVLVGDNADNNQLGRGSISNSTQAFTRIYKEISDVLKSGKKVFIQIKDEKELL